MDLVPYLIHFNFLMKSELILISKGFNQDQTNHHPTNLNQIKGYTVNAIQCFIRFILNESIYLYLCSWVKMDLQLKMLLKNQNPESSRSWKFLMNYNDWWCNIHYRRMVEQTSQFIHSWVSVCRTFVVIQSI